MANNNNSTFTENLFLPGTVKTRSSINVSAILYQTLCNVDMPTDATFMQWTVTCIVSYINTNEARLAAPSNNVLKNVATDTNGTGRKPNRTAVSDTFITQTLAYC
jgi:hypothetical protein